MLLVNCCCWLIEHDSVVIMCWLNGFLDDHFKLFLLMDGVCREWWVIACVTGYVALFGGWCYVLVSLLYSCIGNLFTLVMLLDYTVLLVS